jgi:hypothetical protein
VRALELLCGFLVESLDFPSSSFLVRFDIHADVLFAMSPRGVTVTNQNYLSNTETRLNACVRR